MFKPGLLAILESIFKGGEGGEMVRKIFGLIFASMLLANICCDVCRAEEEIIENETEVDNLGLSRIVITASKIKQTYKNIPVNISIITSEDIEKSGATEITELLDMLPSVDILEYGSFGSTKSVHTRGASSSQVLTLINGRPTYTPRDGVTDFNQIPLSNIERIEVMRGPAATMYGANATGGVINIITKTGTEKMQTEILNKYGSFRTKFASFSNGYKKDNFDYFISYDYLTSEGHRDQAFYRSQKPNVNLGYNLNDDNRISFSGGYYKSKVGTPGKSTGLDLDDRQVAKNKFIDLTWDGKIFENQDILVKVYHNIDRLEFIEAYEPVSASDKDNDVHATKIYGVDLQFSQIWLDAFRTAFGGNFQLHKLNSTASNKHRYNLKALYFETETDLFDSIIFKFGARWDDYSNFGDRISPSVSFAVWLFNKIKLHGQIAKSFRAPTFNDLYWPRETSPWGGGVEGNPNIKPEKATSFELGIGGYLFNIIKTDITAFITKSKDLIEWTADDADWWRPANISSAKIKGIEFESVYNILDNLKLNFNYTYLDAKNLDTDKWLVYRPRSYYKLQLTYLPNTKLKIGLSGRYKTKRFTNASNSIAISPYFTMGADISYKVTENFELLLSGTNIFDRFYEEKEGYPMPGHAIMAGFRLKF